ncbi:response regulator [Nitrosopumilus sp.]|uniref:response regulator n=1 Tax=Nitrosopumilus sp. TaxID=2024843 RepID=UPI0034A0229C
MVNCIVIDDDQDIADIFSELLKINKIDVLAKGNNGKEAVKLYEQHKPDVIFTDLDMPKYDGHYAVEKIKEKYPNSKIIIMTGDINAQNANIFKVLKIPVINKPFNIHEIKQMVTEILITNDTLPMPFEIQYRFKEDDKYYSCVVTYEQYINFKQLPIIQECEITNNNQRNADSHENEMERALELAVKNDTSHIRNLSEVIR